MSSPLNDVLAGFSRKYRKKAKQVEPLIQKYLDEGMIPAQAVDKALKETDFKAYMTKAVKDATLSSAVIGAGSYTVGKSTPLDEAWDPSGMTLSEKLHGTSKAMRNNIINTIKAQLKQGAHAMKSARALYDGYNTTDNVVRKQMLPKYLQDVVNFSRRSDLGKNDVIALQKLVRKTRRVVDRLAQNGAPNRALKTSYKELLDAVELCSDKALKRAIRTAVEEKSRYVAERIARTESARAWYQGFLKDTMDDPDVVAYRWVESTRHPTEDICDEYAKVDAYGLGPGIFPKDKAPELPAHPHCLCHYEKVYASELGIIDWGRIVENNPSEDLQSMYNRRIISKNNLYFNLQLFSEADIKNQSEKSLRKGIRSYQKVIAQHNQKIQNPQLYDKGWDLKDDRQKNGLLRHWKKEIKVAQNSINTRLEELKKREATNEKNE